MNKKEWIIIIIVSVVLIIIGMVLFNKKKEETINNKKDITLTNNFTIDLIKEVHENENYLISPYSIEIALNMLKEGADKNTKEELEKVLNNRKINDLRLKDKLNIANAIFVKNEYKNDILNSYYNVIKNDYKGEILFDEFTSPKVINDWVNKETNGMIPKILDSMPREFVLGIANSIYLNLSWQSEFECNNTREEQFVKVDGSKINVEMMHNNYKYSNVKYLINDDIEGIILPYEDDTYNFEFIAIMPKDGIDSYINNLTIDKLNSDIKKFNKINDNEKVNLSLPRFIYEYEIKDLIKALKELGINDAFDSVKANFSKIGDIKPNIYVDDAIHKTKIELNEKGTKAAAVTYFGLKASAMIPQDEKIINISFNKPFIYMIRESNTGEILFFGSVYEPNTWTKTTCTE